MADPIQLPLSRRAVTDLKPAERFKVEAPAGSALALTIAQNALLAKKKRQLLVVVCAQASDVIRLQEEIPWFEPELKCVVFPDWETLPYDVLSPHTDLVGERLETLWRLVNRKSLKQSAPDVLIVSAPAATQRLAPRSFITATTLFYRKGEEIDIAQMRQQLAQSGYEAVSQVVAPGEFALRGGIVDLFPMGAKQPYRLDFMDDELEQIRLFDPDTQRSLEEVQEIRLLPAHEFFMDEDSREAFCSRWRETFSGDPTRCTVYQDVDHGIASPGLEYYLPLFFDGTETLFDYIGDEAVMLLVGDVPSAIDSFSKETQERARFLAADIVRPILPVAALYLNAEEFFKQAQNYSRLVLTNPQETDPGLPDVSSDRHKTDPLVALREYAARCHAEQRRLLLMAASPGRLETLREMLSERGFRTKLTRTFEQFLGKAPGFDICFGPLYSGMQLDEPPLTILTETELYAGSGKVVRRRRRRGQAESNVNMMIRDLAELKPGSAVVHLEHGIGRYLGLTTIDAGGTPAEFLQLEYAKGDRLYVPVAQLHLISRYSGADTENAPLHGLGRGDWERAKKKAAQQVRDTAAELLNIYAMRQSRQGFAFKFSAADYEAFASEFAFEETEDQTAAIQAVYNDMISPQPMDRLICGDVGFGKTEVALRAAFMAVMGGKQAAVLCPTTLLAEQHAQTFRDRFAGWPVKIAELSRFRSPKETKAALAGLADGSVDIVIGTHKLLGEGVHFANLGLVVIDEEHRFGVRQKERLKALRAEVDILTLTATPIPRTLSMSLEGIRDFSVIATAPQKRLAIKTFVRTESNSVIREAVLRELKRGGQVYFLYNEVETIENKREQLQQLIPEARIAVAHGQMNERELERVMRDFNSQRSNLLLCTTIIETGIDIPNANTIIMHRADKFGLAQLHQLRGRVGRSHHQAYAYLLTPGEGAITKNAVKRLEAIQEMEDLGSGFYLAMHDLEIRGAGEVLGEHQSGSVTGVGFDLYTQMLETAVSSLKAGKEPDLASPLGASSDIDLHAASLLPADYVADVHTRLILYKRLAQAKTRSELTEIQEEIADRFGQLTPQARCLMMTHRIRLEAQALGIKKIDATQDGLVLTFVDNPPFDVAKLFLLLQKSRNMRLVGPNRLRVQAHLETVEQRSEAIFHILKALK